MVEHYIAPITRPVHVGDWVLAHWHYQEPSIPARCSDEVLQAEMAKR